LPRSALGALNFSTDPGQNIKTLLAFIAIELKNWHEFRFPPYNV